MENEYLYIEPKVRRISSGIENQEASNNYDLLFDSNFQRKYQITFEELFSFGFLIINAEPGNGKSRLLKEIVIKSKTFSKKAIYIDLKRLGNEEIEAKINQILIFPQKSFSNNKEINGIKDFFYSETFTFDKNSADLIVCLDALDEVKNDNVFELIDKVKKFRFDYPEVQIILTCRSYIFIKYESDFNELNPQKAEIMPFTEEDAKSFLCKHNFNALEIERVINRFSRGHQFITINSPRILELFVAIKVKEGLDSTLLKTKAELLDHFIYGELLEEEKKSNNNQKEIIKRILEKLALIMEINQSSQISKDELMTFFDDINSGLGSSFLQQISLNDFYDRALLISSDDKHLQFQNVEFQEYLAAKEITRLGKVDQAAFDLVVEKNLRAILPSWANTLRYLIELVPSLQLLIVEFISRNENEISLNLIDQFMISDENIVKMLPYDVRISTFRHILSRFNYFNKYIPLRTAEKLVLYFDEELNLDIKKPKIQSQEEKAIFYNSILIAKCLLKMKKHPEKEVWLSLFISIINDPSFDVQLRTLSIRALSKFEDLDLLRFNIKIENENKIELKDAYYNACIEIDPNALYTIDLMVEHVRNDDSSKIAFRKGFELIKLPDSIKYFLRKLIEDHDFLNRFNFHGFDNNQLRSISDNVETVYDEETKKLITQLVLHPHCYIDHERLIQYLLEINNRKCSNYIFELIDYYKINHQDWYKYYLIFKRILTPENCQSFIEAMLDIAENRKYLVNLFLEFRFSDDINKMKIFEISKDYLNDDYSSLEIQYNSLKKESSNGESIYKGLKIRLQPEPDKYITDVFRYYSENKEVLKSYIQDADVLRFRKLITDTVLKFDFSNASLMLQNRNEDTRNFTASNIILLFSEALPLFVEFNIDISLYRSKVLQYFPYAFLYNGAQNIFNYLGQLSVNEVDQLVSFYQEKRSDDLFLLNIQNLFQVCRHYKIILAIPILKGIVISKKYELHICIEALELIHLLKMDIDFYKELFDKYSKIAHKRNKDLVDLSNSYLIQIPNPFQKESIKWRIDRIVKEPIKIPKSEYEIDTHEIEQSVRNFIKPLQLVSDPIFKDLFIDLLKSSMNIYSMGIEFQTYSVYLWNIVFKYFENLKVHSSFILIKELDNVLVELANLEGYNLLRSYYNELVGVYLSQFSKPSTFAECIAIYNNLKGQKYLSISTAIEFYYLINEIIETDLRKWVEMEGAYQFVTKFSNEEELIQKTVITQFENCLLKRGLRENEVKIRREEQLLNNNRTDFVLSYGFIGQVLIEIKLTRNSDITSKEYPQKLLQYIEGTKSDFGIFLVFQTDHIHKWKKIEHKVKKLYSNMEKIKVIGIDCTNS